MKIESMRGWVTVAPDGNLFVDDERIGAEYPGLVIPLTPESIDEAHKQVVLLLMKDDGEMAGHLALRILTALGITEEAP